MRTEGGALKSSSVTLASTSTVNKSKNVFATEASSYPIILDVDTLEKIFTDRYKDSIKLREAINDRMQEMEKMGGKKKRAKINSRQTPKSLQGHHT